jgi:hypothetical protein
MQFSELKPGDFLYYKNGPDITKKVIIKDITIAGLLNKKITYYFIKPELVDSVREDAGRMAALPTRTVIVPSNVDLCMVMFGEPLLFSTHPDIIEKFVNKSK